MAPPWRIATRAAQAGASLLARDGNSSSISYLEEQMRNPSDILSVMLLLGPDIVRAAVAQQAGRLLTPVAFSFGWAAYAVSALSSAVGDGVLMPDADVSNTTVIEAQSGHSRTTSTWILGRLLRDFNHGVDKEMKNEASHIDPEGPAHPADTKPATNRPSWEGLRITVYEVVEKPPVAHGVPKLDWVWYLGFATILIQLIISSLPWILHRNWTIFMLTAAGNALALVGGSLPQWRQEKWATTTAGGPTVSITKGNGSRQVLVILGKRGIGLDLSILANQTRVSKALRSTRVATVLLAVLWVFYIMVITGTKVDMWYLFGIGLLGSAQNILAAGARRSPEALGLHLKHVETIREVKVSAALRKAEERYPLLGTSLLDVFFPGSLRVQGEELEFWRRALSKRVEPNKYGTPLSSLPLKESKPIPVV